MWLFLVLFLRLFLNDIGVLNTEIALSNLVNFSQIDPNLEFYLKVSTGSKNIVVITNTILPFRTEN
ncbi:hypothetical protein LPBF_07400 [Flavobacterium crassostreae]|uniref:Uncharacterized protein n=1 Tax=Flavobacterium crassostreae TaxID=1763534 RepID=A0A1B9E2G9_9FLAO|nr:hypothetical protein LPBF_07400 [Flavobacterium crassostreae]